MPGPPSPLQGPLRGYHAPPKPIVKPWITIPDLPAGPLVPIPPEPLAAWRNLWHAIGSNLPFYINHSRAARRHLNRVLRTYG